MKKHLPIMFRALTTIVISALCMLHLTAQPYYVNFSTGPCTYGSTNAACELSQIGTSGVYTINYTPDAKEWKIFTPTGNQYFPGGSGNDMWVLQGAPVTFEFDSNTSTPGVTDGLSMLCAPGDWNSGGVWDNTALMTNTTGNTWCYQVASPGTYNWKPVNCGSFDTWEASSLLRHVDNAGNPPAWNVTTTQPNQSVCIDYDPTTGNIVQNSLVVPVSWGDVKAVLTRGQIDVEWSTHSEINNAGFGVERSASGEYFEEIGYVNGKGNSNSITTYSFRDRQPLAGTAYYRIAQYDFDGSVSYSKVTAINNRSGKIYAYPTLTDGEVFVKTDNREGLVVELRDMTGQVLSRQTIDNQSVFELSIAAYPPGTYLLFVVDQRARSVVHRGKVIRQH